MTDRYSGAKDRRIDSQGNCITPLFWKTGCGYKLLTCEMTMHNGAIRTPDQAALPAALGNGLGCIWAPMFGRRDSVVIKNNPRFLSRQQRQNLQQTEVLAVLDDEQIGRKEELPTFFIRSQRVKGMTTRTNNGMNFLSGFGKDDHISAALAKVGRFFRHLVAYCIPGTSIGSQNRNPHGDPSL